MKVILLLALAATLLLTGEARPASPSLNGGIKESRLLPPQLLSRRQPLRREEPEAAQARPVRVPVTHKLAQLSDDEREVMTKQIMSSISGMKAVPL